MVIKVDHQVLHYFNPSPCQDKFSMWTLASVLSMTELNVLVDDESCVFSSQGMRGTYGKNGKPGDAVSSYY